MATSNAICGASAGWKAHQTRNYWNLMVDQWKPKKLAEELDLSTTVEGDMVAGGMIRK
jgi:hypothetical protein